MRVLAFNGSPRKQWNPKMVAPRFDAEKKARRRAEIFPEDCQKAFALGARIAATGTS